MSDKRQRQRSLSNPGSFHESQPRQQELYDASQSTYSSSSQFPRSHYSPISIQYPQYPQYSTSSQYPQHPPPTSSQYLQHSPPITSQYP